MKQLFYLMLALACAMLACILTGCSSTRVVTIPEIHERIVTDTVHDMRVDSIYIAHYVRERGDTVHITDTVFRYKVLHEIETRTETMTDSIPYAVEVQVPVRVRNGYDRFTSWGFWILLLLTLLRVAWWFVKKYYLRR